MKTSSPGSGHPSPSRQTRSWSNYLPLLVVVAVTSLAAAATSQAYDGDHPLQQWMKDFMGFFMVIFGMLKLFDLTRFADGFQMYDLLAKRFRPYALVYPFVELLLGLGYLAEKFLTTLYATTIAVMSFSALGVIRALSKGLDVRCACMGNILKVPLSTVALVEDLGMATMAALMWLRPA